MSSSAPTIVISAAAARIPSVRWLSGRNSSPATSAPPKIASPPSSGVRPAGQPDVLQLVHRADAPRETRRERRQRRPPRRRRPARRGRPSSPWLRPQDRRARPTSRRQELLTSRKPDCGAALWGRHAATPTAPDAPSMPQPLAHAFLALADDDPPGRPAHAPARASPPPPRPSCSPSARRSASSSSTRPTTRSARSSSKFALALRR